MAKTKSITDRVTGLLPGGGRSKQPAGVGSVVSGLRDRFLGGGSDRSTAGRKAAITRKRNSARRSQAAKRGARTRAKQRSKR